MRPFQDSAHAEEGGHVALEDLVHDVLPQKLLGLRDAGHKGALRETAAQEVLMEMADQGAGVSSDRGEAVLGPLEELGQGNQWGQAGRGDLFDLEVFVEGKGGQAHRVPPTDTRFLALRSQRSG